MLGRDLVSRVQRHQDQKAKCVCSGFVSARLLYVSKTACQAGVPPSPTATQAIVKMHLLMHRLCQAVCAT